MSKAHIHTQIWKGLLCMAACSGLIWHNLSAQEPDVRAVSGTAVSLRTGMPLEGINIGVLQSPGILAVSDSTGSFQINVPDKNASLVASFPGYKSLEIPLRGRTSIRLELAETGEASMDDPIEVAYNSKAKKNLIDARDRRRIFVS